MLIANIGVMASLVSYKSTSCSNDVQTANTTVCRLFYGMKNCMYTERQRWMRKVAIIEQSVRYCLILTNNCWFICSDWIWQYETIKVHSVCNTHAHTYTLQITPNTIMYKKWNYGEISLKSKSKRKMRIQLQMKK